METTLRELSRNVHIRLNGAARMPYDKQDQWQQERTDFGRSYSLTAFYKGRRMTFDFWDSLAGNGMSFDSKQMLDSEEVPEIMDSLLSDCVGYGYGSATFEEFCSEFGYDTDSIKALKTYQACKKQTQKLRGMLRDDFGAFMQSERP